MNGKKLWHLAALVVLAMLPLAGCSGGGGVVGEKGVTMTVAGNVDVPKSAGKSTGAATTTVGTVKVFNAYSTATNAALGTADIQADGTFANLTFSMPATKSVVVFKAAFTDTTKPTLRTVVPIDLSNPPAGLSNNNVSIVIDANTTAAAALMSADLGLSGLIGDVFLHSSVTYLTVAQSATKNGGQVLAFGTNGFTMTGTVVSATTAALLPAQDASTFTNDDLNNIVIGGKITSAFIPGKNPVVNFTVTNKATGKGITGLRTFGLHVAKLNAAANGSSTSWTNYIDKGISLPSALAFATYSTSAGRVGAAATGSITKPTSDPALTLVTKDTVGRPGTNIGDVLIPGYQIADHGDGTYTATFGSDITSNANAPYDNTAVTRIAVTVTSIAIPGVTATGPINPTTKAVNTSIQDVNRAAFVYDFTPATAAVYVNANKNADGTTNNFAREIVTTGACEKCHDRLVRAAGGHTGGRPDTRVCVICHTSTNTSGEGEFVTFIHRIHMGEELPAMPQLESAINPTKPIPHGFSKTTPLGTPLVKYQEQTYPQDIRNCTLCHNGVDGGNYATQMNRKNCVSCHNDKDFTLTKGTKGAHSGGAQSDDTKCSVCHDGGFAPSPELAHLPIAPPDNNNAALVYYGTNTTGKDLVTGDAIPVQYAGNFTNYSAAVQLNALSNLAAPGNSNTNASWVAAASLSRLPAGAKAITYVVKSTSKDSSNHPVIVFKLQMATADASGKLGTPVDVVFNPTPPTNNPANLEMIPNFVGSPSIYFAWAVPQDGITAPADYNASASAYLKRIWDHTATSKGGASQDGTISGPATVSGTTGLYTVTLNNVTIPSNATMLVGGLGYTYGIGSAKTKLDSAKKQLDLYVPFVTTTQPLTQIDLAAYPYTAASLQGGLSVPADNKWAVASGYTGRRLITDTAKCNNCHGRLGVNPTFHAGQRNDAQTCTFCHNVHKLNSGWAVNIKEAVHSIHGAGKRVNKFSWEATAGDKYWEVTYPGVLRDCEQCHIAGMYDFSDKAYNTANSATDASLGTVLDNLLYSDVATGIYGAAKGDAVKGTSLNVLGVLPSHILTVQTGLETILGSDLVLSPFVAASPTDYGSGFDATKVNTASAYTNASPWGQAATYSNNLVVSPITAACAACHDTAAARAHMAQNGGSFYVARSAALATKEGCIVCHGPVSNGVNVSIPTIKQVHRWW
jgi:OmcA/MtrC family decaheme c-type cytochrome